MFNPLFYRPLGWIVLGAVLLLFLSLGLLLANSWRAMQRLEPVHSQLQQIDRLQQTALQMEQALLENLHAQTPWQAERFHPLRQNVRRVIRLELQSGNRAAPHLKRILTVVETSQSPAPAALLKLLSELQPVVRDEIEGYNKVLGEMYRNSRREFALTAVLVVALPLLGAVLLFLLRRRVFLPLHNLGTLMNLLAEQTYRPAPSAGVDPVLRPLFGNYNALVARLAQLEEEHQRRQTSLENEVRAATRTLLEQQHRLAYSERLAAVGEVAAGVAHELRNPLAGVQMAAANLRRDLTQPEQVERLDLIIAELKRLARLLNDLLNQARHTPEPAQEINLAESVAELLALARYQVPEGVRLEHSLPAEWRCRLPSGELRQALLNLVLNAAQADGTTQIEISARLEQGRLYLQIRDDGPGLPPQLLEQGVRAFSTWREHGTGLGLLMVQRFARGLGGELEFAKREPQGACITLKLPC